MVIEIKSGKEFKDQELTADIQLSLICTADKIHVKLKKIRLQTEKWKN